MINPQLAQEWRDRLDDFAVSQMSVQEWCDFNGVSTYQYYYWRRRLAPTPPETAAPPHFVAVGIVDTPPLPAAPICPAAPGGVSIRIAGAAIEVTPGFDAALLRAVVAALANGTC